MKKIATLIAATALTAGLTVSASAQGLTGLGNGLNQGQAIVGGIGLITMIVVLEDETTVTTTP
tara:strand:+ start:173292 stop:173480 length:189 start_codon:yes stop_codon:yes gene_type:complete